MTYNYGTSSGLDDSISRLTSISDGNTTLESYAYLGLGTVVERDHPESGANLTYIKLTGESDGDAGDQYTGLDRFSRVVDQRWIDGSGTALDRYGYSYDRNSNRLTKSNSLNGNLSESYSYDDLNRLTAATRGNASYQSWNLDGLGNMNSVTTGNVTETRTHNDQNQLLTMGNATLAFDNNGNTVTDDQGHTLVYDAWNRLVAVKNGATVLKTFTYDGQGWRISETPAAGTATDLYYSSQWQVLEERQAGNATAQNVWGITYVDQLVLRDRDADQDASHTLEERLYALQDANENVTAIITTSGAVAERYVLDPYGVVSVRNADWSVRGNGTVSASGYAWQYLHQGGRFDGTANQYSFRHRDYSPTMMRWMQQDPLGYVDGANNYAAYASRPATTRDPEGLEDEPKVGDRRGTGTQVYLKDATSQTVPTHEERVGEAIDGIKKVEKLKEWLDRIGKFVPGQPEVPLADDPLGGADSGKAIADRVAKMAKGLVERNGVRIWVRVDYDEYKCWRSWFTPWKTSYGWVKAKSPGWHKSDLNSGNGPKGEGFRSDETVKIEEAVREATKDALKQVIEDKIDANFEVKGQFRG